MADYFEEGGVGVLEADLSNPFQAAADSFVLPGEPETTVTDYDNEPLPAEDENEDAWSGTLDHEAIDKVIKASLPPEGWYEGQGLGCTRVLRGKDGIERHVFRYFGKATREGREARIRFSISRDAAYKETADGSRKLAWDFQLFQKARKAFAYAIGRQPATMGELDDFLQNGILRYRVVHTEDDILVVDLAGVKV